MHARSGALDSDGAEMLLELLEDSERYVEEKAGDEVSAVLDWNELCSFKDDNVVVRNVVCTVSANQNPLSEIYFDVCEAE